MEKKEALLIIRGMGELLLNIMNCAELDESVKNRIFIPFSGIVHTLKMEAFPKLFEKEYGKGVPLIQGNI